MLKMGLFCPIWHCRDRHEGPIAWFDLSVRAGDTRHSYRPQCEQFKLVSWLYKQLAETEQAELLFAHEVVKLTRGDRGIFAAADGPDRNVVRKGRYLIAPDPGRSAVRNLLGVDFERYTHPECFLISVTTSGPP